MNELPTDYEVCGECGYDHGYDYEEAYKWHKAEETRMALENLIEVIKDAEKTP